MNDHLKPKGYANVSWLKIAKIFPDKYEIVESYDPDLDQRRNIIPNDQAERQAGNATQPESRTTKPPKTVNPKAGGQFAPAPLFGDFS